MLEVGQLRPMVVLAVLLQPMLLAPRLQKGQEVAQRQSHEPWSNLLAIGAQGGIAYE